MQRFDDDERRRRIGLRHRLADGTRDHDLAAAAASVVALHGTDPGSTFVSAWARCDDGLGVAEVERALYDDRTLVRVMAMRRTVFVAPVDDVPVLLAGAADDVAREERRKLVALLGAGGVDEPDAWLRRVEQVAVDVVARLGEATPADLVAADERLATTVVMAPGTRNETTVRIASRVLTVLGAQGRVVRGRPKGSWTSTQFRWSTLADWSPAAAVAIDPRQAEADLARRWLARFGPAPEADLTWWTRWTKTRTRRALAAIDAVEVDLGGVGGGPAWALADDLEPTPDVGPWVALLPALDATPMGWKHRDFYLGDHGPALFDTTGNIAGTAWCDGRVVGGWVHLPGGQVAVRLLDDIGSEASAALAMRAERLAATIGDVRLTPRGRRTAPLERKLLDT
ncbi:AlkZ family DNA glycosylase [Aeromicrobium sp. CFBP 8757]|uniref:winged helix DNA-binding domain-containing protein n=1 Tax=Aeromicrobium sp. CFBP 8757 TaxID=2775288 RepID=UPI0017806A91|nr:winged helix DNA-binding domain-containing protein [Aeromicrobium sp. CFBP 8757]MBD8607046.1 AlkZ family DNA glycosylase [Aeromicrobium sp. CFBP 8757]